MGVRSGLLPPWKNINYRTKEKRRFSGKLFVDKKKQITISG
jgi:hypothetical protein